MQRILFLGCKCEAYKRTDAHRKRTFVLVTWWGRQGSNLRPRDYESPALTTELRPLELAFADCLYRVDRENPCKRYAITARDCVNKKPHEAHFRRFIIATLFVVPTVGFHVPNQGFRSLQFHSP